MSGFENFRMPLVDPSRVQPLPQFAPQPEKPSRLQGLLSRISQGATQARDRLMPSPTGMEGLLSEQDVGNARSQGLIGLGVGLLNSRGGGFSPLADGIENAQKSYGESLMGTMEQKQAGVEWNTQQDLLKKKAALSQQYPVHPDMSADEMREMYVAYMQAGVPVPPGLSEIIKTMEEKPLAHIDSGDRTDFVDKAGNVVRSVKKGLSPRDPNATAGIQMQRDFAREQQLGDDFNKDTKAYREIGSKMGNALRESEAAMRGDPAAQVNMLYAFVSAMDPTSVVREGELALVRSAAPLRAQAEALIGKYVQNDKSFAVSPQMVRSLASLMERRMGDIESYVNERGEYYANRAGRWGVDGDVFRNTMPKRGPAGRPAGSTLPNVNVTGSRIRGVK